MPATIAGYEVLELFEDTITDLVPVVMAHDDDRFVVVSGGEEEDLESVDRDRRVIVLDDALPERVGGTAGCQVAKLNITVTISYRVTREARRRRMVDMMQIDAALRALRSATPAIRRMTVTPGPNLLMTTGSWGIMSGWAIEVEYNTSSLEEG